jgi:glycosyltransferase involved in cell wall biosynthesis
MEKTDQKIVVLTTVFNCEKWIKKCIDSIKSQKVTNFECYLLDDMSTDNSVEKAKEAIGDDTRFNIISNTKKYYQVGNYEQVLRSDHVDNEDIIVQVDGDDWLPDDEVFTRVLNNFEDGETWLAYGQFEYHDGRPGFAAPFHPAVDCRKEQFQLCALRAWKAFLWRHIRTEDLYDSTGWFPHRGGDTFFMFPMVEMATHQHTKFMPEVNYIYNEANPLNDHKGETGMQEQTESANCARDKEPYPPLNLAYKLFTPLRFDLIAKMLYGAYKEMQLETSFAEDVYKAHLHAWSDGKFVEYDNPEKNSYEKYKECFDELLTSMREEGFKKEFAVPCTQHGYLLNGAHRTAAAFLYNRTIQTEVDMKPEAGQINCSSDFFRSIGLEEKWLDAMALEYAKMKRGTKVITLYPARNSTPEQEKKVEELIDSSVPIVYEKTLDLNEDGLYNYISQLYFGEDWLSDGQNPLAGVGHQTEKCKGSSSVKVYLVESPDPELTDKLKEEIREIYGIGKPSCHINDTFEQTLRAARVAFNENSIHFMNHNKLDPTSKLAELLSTYGNTIRTHRLNPDIFCVTGSAIMTLFGLRDCADLDYLHLDPAHVMGGSELINSHEKELDKYPLHKHDILFNHFNHFFFNDIKFATLDVVKALKEKRGEEKDIKDVKLMESLSA